MSTKFHDTDIELNDVISSSIPHTTTSVPANSDFFELESPQFDDDNSDSPSKSFLSHPNTSTIDDNDDDYNDEFNLPKTVDFLGHAVVLESKNVLKSHKLKFQALACFLSLGILGLMDQALGSILQYLLEYYNADRTQISYIFLFQFIGYMAASFVNEKLHNLIGMQKLMIIALGTIIIDTFMFILKAPLLALYIAAIILGFGGGTIDCTLNLFVGKLLYSNQLLGAMHGFYGLGCFISPILAIGLIQKGMAWNHYYIILFCGAVISLILTAFLFRNETKWKYQYSVMKDEEKETNQEPVSMTEVIFNKYVLAFSVALFVYIGTELCVGVWLFNYLLTIKNAIETHASYITSSYWAFFTVGRFVLGFVTGHWFEDLEVRAIVIYTFIISFCCLNFWVFSSSTGWQVISIDIAGFFVGPMFATSMIISIKTLPKRLANAGVPMVCGIGSSGAAIIPWVMGVIAEKAGGNGAGLVYFPKLIFGTFFSAFIFWVLIYFLNKQKLDNYERLG